MTTKNAKERNNDRRSRLGQYFLNMSLAVFVGMVIGGATAFKDNNFQMADMFYLAVGIFFTYVFASIGNKIF